MEREIARGSWGKGASVQSLPLDLPGPWRTREGGVPDASPHSSPHKEWDRDMRQSSGTKSKLLRGGLWP